MDTDSPYRKAMRQTGRSVARIISGMPSPDRLLQYTVALLAQVVGALCMGISPAPPVYALVYGVALPIVAKSVLAGVVFAVVGFLLIGFGTHLEWA